MPWLARPHTEKSKNTTTSPATSTVLVTGREVSTAMTIPPFLLRFFFALHYDRSPSRRHAAHGEAEDDEEAPSGATFI